MERAARVGYQGEPGAFSEEAVGLLFPDGVAVPFRSLRPLFEAVRQGDLEFAVVPIENSQAGSINETYDLLAAGDASIVGEALLRVDHALVALPGTRLEDLRTVASHPQALAQCQEFLSGLPVEAVPVYDTAGAARRIAEERREGEAAIASERAAAMYGLDVLARRIQTLPENWTRFGAIAATGEPLGPAERTSLVLVTANEPGALYRCLGVFAERDLNMSKLESRPMGDEPWKYRFYLDVDAGLGDAALGAALEELGRVASSVRVLGSYPRWHSERRSVGAGVARPPGGKESKP